MHHTAAKNFLPTANQTSDRLALTARHATRRLAAANLMRDSMLRKAQSASRKIAPRMAAQMKAPA